MRLKEALRWKASPEDIRKSLIENNKSYFQLLTLAATQAKDAFSVAEKQDSFLVRGSNNMVLQYFRKPGTTKRVPIDTPKEVDDYIEKYRKKKYRNIPSRQKATFMYVANGNQKFANVYVSQYGGETFLVFPKNGAKYFQSTSTIDLYTSPIQHNIANWLEDEKSGANDQWPEREKRNLEALDDYFKTGYTDLKKMKKDAEVVVEHKGYYAFNKDVWENYCSILKIYPKELCSKVQIEIITNHLKEIR